MLFGLNLSLFLQATAIKEHIEKFKDEYSEDFKVLDSCLYANDLVTSVDNIEEAFKIFCWN